jgi:dTDP-4-dehydrorhamnose 3,5-epimerase
MTSRFDQFPTPLSGLQVVQRKPIGDERGFLERLYCSDEMRAIGLEKPVQQINRTLTKKRGTVRGMHFQHPPHAETKIVSCLRGEVFDVAVDLRRDSETFLQWYGETLSADNHKTLLIPEGFAHGFQTLTDDCELLYLHTAEYRQSAEDGLHPEDPELNIEWPLPITELSARDSAHRAVAAEFEGISL